MTSVCLYFKVHQPFRLKPHSYLDIGEDVDNIENEYFEKKYKDKKVFRKVAKKCYYPTNDVLLQTIKDLEDVGEDFKISFSLTGTFIEQCKMYDPGVLDSFKELVNTGKVEILSETYYHSLSSLFDEMDEFREQVKMQNDIIEEEFDQRPKVFSNTEALYNNRIAKTVEDMGFKGILTEGADRILGWRSPNYLYKPPSEVGDISVLTKNYRLSDDIAFRFSLRSWDKWPLTADKYSNWLEANEGDVINLFMDYETFGEHQWADTGIFSFLKDLPGKTLERDGLDFKTPSEIVDEYDTQGEIDVFEYDSVSWADQERDVSAWVNNWMQRLIFEELKMLESKVKETGDEKMLRIWRLLQTSDHLYYLSTKGEGDGDVHSYFSSFDNVYDAFRSYLEVIRDFKKRVNSKI